MLPCVSRCPLNLSFFFHDTPTTDIYTLSLHDALPISTARRATGRACRDGPPSRGLPGRCRRRPPRSSSKIGRAQSELQSHSDLVCRLLLEKKKKKENENNTFANN